MRGPVLGFGGGGVGGGCGRRAAGGDAFVRALGVVAAAAEQLQVGERVVVAWCAVVDVAVAGAAPAACPAVLAGGVVSPPDALDDGWPVVWQSGAAGAPCPGWGRVGWAWLVVPAVGVRAGLGCSAHGRRRGAGWCGVGRLVTVGTPSPGGGCSDATGARHHLGARAPSERKLRAPRRWFASILTWRCRGGGSGCVCRRGVVRARRRLGGSSCG